MSDGRRASFGLALRNTMQPHALKTFDCTWRDFAQRSTSESSKQRTHPKSDRVPRALVVFGPIEERALAELIVCRIGIPDKLCKRHRSVLLAHISRQTRRALALGLFRFVLGTRFGNTTPILMIPKIVPPCLASFSNCQKTSPPFCGCSHRG
jgi:hypothetical protein